MKDSSFKQKLNDCTNKIIVNDGNTILSLAKTVNSRIVPIMLLPFFGLYCREAQDFNNVRILDDETAKQINDLRNFLKTGSDKYGRTYNTILGFDFKENERFKNELRFNFSKNWNIHYNLGIYFDRNGHIIGDTQLIGIYFDKVNLNHDELNELAYIIGKKIGVSIGRIQALSGRKFKAVQIEMKEPIKIGYFDINTNVEKRFFKKMDDKGLNLLHLHLLGMLGFDKYIIQNMLECNNTWRLRCEYITAHNIWLGLSRIKNHFEMIGQNEVDLLKLSNLVENGKFLFPSKYRNCMMHYSFMNDNEPAISEDKFEKNKVFCGLVESCFDGKDYSTYYNDLRAYLQNVECYLEDCFEIEYDRIKWDL